MKQLITFVGVGALIVGTLLRAFVGEALTLFQCYAAGVGISYVAAIIYTAIEQKK